MATTTNYGWTTPDDTALVKDGAAAIRTLGTSVDTTTKNLNPETTLGDISFRSSTSNVNTRLGIGGTGTVLTVASGVPTWSTPAAATPTTAAAIVDTNQNTTSTSYTDLATAGPAVTLTTGTKVLVIIGAAIVPQTQNCEAFMSYAISGATTSAANDTRAISFYRNVSGIVYGAYSKATTVTVTAGSNTFTAKYKVGSAGNADILYRYMFAMDLGS